MDVTTAAASINWLAVIVAAVSAFVVGGLWYGPLFGRAWLATTGLSEEELGRRNMGLVFGLSFVLILVATINLALFIGAEADLVFGAMAGFFAGLGWVATFLGVVYLFEKKSLTAWLVNAGYSVVALTVIGAILGVW